MRTSSKNYFESDKVKLFSTVTKTSIEYLTNISEDSMRNNVYCVNCIFIENSICTLDKFKSFINY